MKIEIYEEVKKAFKDALSEWFEENKSKITGVHSKNEDQENLLTKRQFCEKHTFISDGGLRNKLAYREWNKFDSCISKVGKRVLINEKKALEYFKNPPFEVDWTYDKNKYGTR